MNVETDASGAVAPRRYQVWAGETAPAVFLGSTADRAQAIRLVKEDVAACPNTPADRIEGLLTWSRKWWVLPALGGVLDDVPREGTSADPKAKSRATKLPFFYRARLSIPQEGPKRHQRRLVERGPWAPPPAPPKGWMKLLERVERLRKAEDGTKVRDLGMSPKTAQKLATMLADGRAWWGNRSQKVKPAKVRLERDDKDPIVRKGA